MEIHVSEQDKISVLTLKGKLDLANAARLKEEVKSLLEQQRNQVHLNMKDVDFINSSGLGALVSLMKEIRVNRGRLTLSDQAPYVNEIFEITQLSHVFEIYDTVDDALASYSAVSITQPAQ